MSAAKFKRRAAWLRDIECAPGQIGACTIVAPSVRGPEWVIVEWQADRSYHDNGDASCVRLSSLRVPKE